MEQQIDVYQLIFELDHVAVLVFPPQLIHCEEHLFASGC